MIELLSSAIFVFFVVMDPVGVLPVFIGLTQGFTSAQRRYIAIKGCIVAGIVLGLFAYFGNWFLSALGISLSAFRIAGGALLFLIAVEMLFERRTARKSAVAGEAVNRTQEEAQDIAVFPLAIPLLAGPGALTSMLLLMGRAPGMGGQALVLLACAINMALVLILLISGEAIARKLGRTLMNTISRVLGLMLAALAIQFIVDGIMEIAGRL
jgi:multiple antibiotic resistance protein